MGVLKPNTTFSLKMVEVKKKGHDETLSNALETSELMQDDGICFYQLPLEMIILFYASETLSRSPLRCCCAYIDQTRFESAD